LSASEIIYGAACINYGVQIGCIYYANVNAVIKQLSIEVNSDAVAVFAVLQNPRYYREHGMNFNGVPAV